MLTRRLAPEGPLTDEAGFGWQVCNAETAADFSACGYFFGRQLLKDLDVPIGLIATAWGGTDIAAWISREKFEAVRWQPFYDSPDEQERIWNTLKTADNFKALLSWLERFDACGKAAPECLAPEFDDSGWKPCPGATAVLPRPGRYVCRLSFELPAEFAGRELELKLGIINDVDATFFNGEAVGSTGVETPAYWSAERKYTVPGRCVRAGRNCIAVVADDHYGAGWSTFRSWNSPRPDWPSKFGRSAGSTRCSLSRPISRRARMCRPSAPTAVRADRTTRPRCSTRC